MSVKYDPHTHVKQRPAAEKQSETGPWKEFNGNTGEELCNRWIQLAAFMPFFSQSDIEGAISQGPHRWDNVASASRTSIAARYSLLRNRYILSVNASLYDTSPVPPIPLYSPTMNNR
ncbi:hypothetical protein IW261DRAFT_1572774 [Armillaria novae-zelandiae]|uniref:Glycoside hydrolase family 31 TIM barrel domain-containing protein n=1 Tax=Armillaria novae-zelandiae TaxID=153914 RepID=A0AA39U4X9_9AGAR|nr:hypothetical protein IW261DRAFT_1572774 [Armillaria novae-zelandiae]